MTPGEASAKGAILIVDHPAGGPRPAAHLFDVPGGIAYVDHGWTENDTGHTVHRLAGDTYPAGDSWLLVTQEGEDVAIWRAEGRAKPDGNRAEAWAALQQTILTA